MVMGGPLGMVLVGRGWRSWSCSVMLTRGITGRRSRWGKGSVSPNGWRLILPQVGLVEVDEGTGGLTGAQGEYLRLVGLRTVPVVADADSWFAAVIETAQARPDLGVAEEDDIRALTPQSLRRRLRDRLEASTEIANAIIDRRRGT